MIDKSFSDMEDTRLVVKMPEKMFVFLWPARKNSRGKMRERRKNTGIKVREDIVL